jgi:hypothetical protein
LISVFALAKPAAAIEDLTVISDKLSNNVKNVASNHTITFTTNASTGFVLDDDDNDNIFVDFIDADWDLTGLVLNDLDLKDDATEMVLGANCSSTEEAGVTISVGADTIRFDVCTDYADAGIAAGSVVEIEIGANATSGGAGTKRIINANDAAVHDIVVQTRDNATVKDQAIIQVDLIDNVFTASATVESYLSFSIATVGSGVTTGGVTTDAASTATTIPFGIFDITGSSVNREVAQTVQVSTNGTGGYTVFMNFSQVTLTSTIGDDIDAAAGTNAVPAAWAAPNNTGDENGLIGYHTTDGSLGTGTTTRFNTNDTYAKAHTADTEVAYNNAPVSAQATDIIFRVEVTALQEAGLYQDMTVDYIAVPIY